MTIDCVISTPQHSPYEENPQSPYKGKWTWNKSKRCYEIYFTQKGKIDTDTWLFTPDDVFNWREPWKYPAPLRGAHKVQFKDEQDFLKAKV